MKKALFLALALVAFDAQAQMPPGSPAFGGQVVMVDNKWHVEFAVRDGGIRVWVRDLADASVPVARLGGKATLLGPGGRMDVMLTPDKDLLKADAPVKAADKLAAVLSLTVDGKPMAARFGQAALVQPPLSGPSQAGKAPFEAICAVCHGASMRGTDNGPPLLHPFYAAGHHDDAMVLSAVNNGAKAHHWKFGDMPKPEGVKPGQDKEILAYLRAMQTANGIGGDMAAMPMPMDHSMHKGH